MRDEAEGETDRSVIDLAQEALTGLGEVVPRLVDRSRRQVDFALAVLERLRCSSSAHHDGHEAHPTGAPSEGPILAVVPDPVERSAPASTEVPKRKAKAAVDDAPASSTLSIPDYDSLAASQVLPRLAGLTDDELEAIRAYEAAHRNRRTVLGRLAQLLGDGHVSSTVSARAATPDDVGDIRRLRALAADDVRALRGGAALLASLDPPDVAIDSGASSDRAHLVGVVGAAVVGYGVLVRAGTRAELAELYCERPGRGVGVGDAVLQLAIDVARSWGCDALDSHTLPADRGTKNFFEAHAMVSRLIVVSRSLDER